MKLSCIDDYQLTPLSGIVITQLCQTSSHRYTTRAGKLTKFTIKLPSVEHEKSFQNPLKPNTPSKSHSLSRLKQRTPINITSHNLEISILEDPPNKLLKSKSIKKIKSRNIYTATNKIAIEALNNSLSKFSSVMMPLPYTEFKLLENKRHTSRLRILRKVHQRVDKENIN